MDFKNRARRFFRCIKTEYPVKNIVSGVVICCVYALFASLLMCASAWYPFTVTPLYGIVKLTSHLGATLMLTADAAFTGAVVAASLCRRTQSSLKAALLLSLSLVFVSLSYFLCFCSFHHLCAMTAALFVIAFTAISVVLLLRRKLWLVIILIPRIIIFSYMFYLLFIIL